LNKIVILYFLISPVAPYCSTQDSGGGVGSKYKGWRWVGLGLGLGIRGRRWVGLGIESLSPAPPLPAYGTIFRFRLYFYISIVHAKI